MRSVLVLQLDGKMPNLALMRIAAYHRRIGHTVEYRQSRNIAAIQRGLFDSSAWDWVYASAIFEASRPLVRELLRIEPKAIVGGSGWDEDITLADAAIPIDEPPDYSDHPNYPHSIGFTQRGCRLSCSFCKVPRMEGRVKKSGTIHDIWRGEPWPRNLLLLDNDFFGQPGWRDEIERIREGHFKVCWNQGFNVRLIDDEHAVAIATVDYRDDQFKTKRLYTAWDNCKDKDRLFRNLETLVRHGVNPDNILVYVLIGYDHATKSARPTIHDDDFYRHRELRAFGCRPYPMPYARTPSLTGFQRWIVAAYDKRVTWDKWEAAKYEPRNLGREEPQLFNGAT